MSQDELKDFEGSGKKLGWTEEEVEIPVFTPVIDKERSRVTIKQETQRVKQKVLYAHSVPRRIICPPFTHTMFPLDAKKYIFKCKECDFHYKANTLTHKFVPESSQVVYRHNGQQAV